MQMICDGVATKNEVLQDSIMQYQEVFVKAKREFETVVQVSYILVIQMPTTIYRISSSRRA